MTVGLLLASVGCDSRDENPYRPNAPLRQKWSANGDRLAIYDADDEIAYKLRRRARGVKVYDRDLRPAGYVRAAGTDETDAGDDGGQTDADASERGVVRVRPIGKTEIERLERQKSGLWALGDAVRLEQTPDGWAVFGGDGNWVGRFFRGDESQWQLATDQAGSEVWRAVGDGTSNRVKRGDETAYRAPGETVSEEVLLALALEGLPVLHRVAVGRWLEARRE